MDNNKPAIVGVKKRQQIKNANKAVFIWVAAAATVVMIAVVLSQFMLKQFFFNADVISAQGKTNNILKDNAKNYEPLRIGVLKLLSSKQLTALKISPDDNALQVVIDAMPTENDQIGLAASLQQSVLTKSGVMVERLNFDAGVPAASTPTTPAATTASTPAGSLNEVTFSLKATGTYDQIKKLLEDFHKSIRPISVVAIKLSGSSGSIVAEIQAKTFYATPQTTDMTKETKKP